MSGIKWTGNCGAGQETTIKASGVRIMADSQQLYLETDNFFVQGGAVPEIQVFIPEEIISELLEKLESWRSQFAQEVAPGGRIAAALKYGWVTISFFMPDFHITGQDGKRAQLSLSLPKPWVLSLKEELESLNLDSP